MTPTLKLSGETFSELNLRSLILRVLRNTGLNRFRELFRAKFWFVRNALAMACCFQC